MIPPLPEDLQGKDLHIFHVEGISSSVDEWCEQWPCRRNINNTLAAAIKARFFKPEESGENFSSEGGVEGWVQDGGEEIGLVELRFDMVGIGFVAELVYQKPPRTLVLNWYNRLLNNIFRKEYVVGSSTIPAGAIAELDHDRPNDLYFRIVAIILLLALEKQEDLAFVRQFLERFSEDERNPFAQFRAW